MHSGQENFRIQDIRNTEYYLETAHAHRIVIRMTRVKTCKARRRATDTEWAFPKHWLSLSSRSHQNLHSRSHLRCRFFSPQSVWRAGLSVEAFQQFLMIGPISSEIQYSVNGLSLRQGKKETFLSWHREKEVKVVGKENPWSSSCWSYHLPQSRATHCSFLSSSLGPFPVGHCIIEPWSRMSCRRLLNFVLFLLLPR